MSQSRGKCSEKVEQKEIGMKMTVKGITRLKAMREINMKIDKDKM